MLNRWIYAAILPLCFTPKIGAEELSTKECKGAHTMRVGVRHIEGKGVGYNTGYSTLESFLAPSRDLWSVMPFLDLRGHVFDNGKFAANAGLGIRTMANCRIYGANAYYDYRNTSRQHYNQVALGFETLGIRWDFRLNGYLPVGAKTSSPYDKKSSTNYVFDSFSGHNAFIKQTTKVSSKTQFAMKGLNAEAAFHFLKNENYDLYAAAGPYYYNYGSRQAIGGQARITAQIFEYLSLEVMNSYDSRFHENFQGSVGINIPFGRRQTPSKNKKLSQCKDSCLLSQRLVQPVKRQEIIVVDRFRSGNTTETVSVAINPETQTPYTFWFVDNTSHSAGTYESPFPTLTAAQNASGIFDIIYVYSGDGTAAGTNSGITLKDYQQLLGSSTAQPLNTTVGTITIPAQTTTLPILGNALGGNVIVVANSNCISGFVINPNDGGTAILNTAPITNLIVANNAIITPSNSCINIYNVSGVLEISNNTMTTNSFTNPAITITNTDIHNAVYTINNNAINTATELLHIAYTDSSAITTNIMNNFFINDLPSATIALNNASFTTEHIFNISSNTFYSQDQSGVIATLSNFANASIYCTSNQLINLTKEVDTQACLSVTTNNNSVCNLTLNNNTMQSANFGFIASANNQSTLNMTANQNFFGGGDSSGASITTNNNALAAIALTGNTFRAIDDDALKFTSNSSNSTTFTVIDNTFMATTGEHTLNCTAASSGPIISTIENNHFSFGLFNVSNSGSGSSRSIITGNQFIDTVITITNSSTGSLCQQFNNNTSNITRYANGSNPYTISNTGGGALRLEPLTNNVGFFTLTDVTSVNPNSCESFD